MKKFVYKAKNKDGKEITGSVEASTIAVAVKLLQKKGFVVINVKPARSSFLYLYRQVKSRVSFGDVVAFSRQLATMVNAGLPITESLAILRNQSNQSMQEVVGRILVDIEGGESLSTALSKYPKIFSKTYVALIKSGEAGGVLDKVLTRLADNLERQQEFRGKVKGALIYPVIIIIGMFLVGFIMMIFVIPRLLSLYTEFDAELPLPTKILIAISNVFSKFWVILVLLIFLGIWGFQQYRKTKLGKLKIDELILSIPIIGDLQRQIILTELTRTLSLMVGAGVSILEGISITSGVLKNEVISQALDDAGRLIEKGYPVAYSFAKHPDAFPYILSQMIAVGEETGKMEEVLMKVSRVFEVESEQKVKALTSAVEPMIMIVLGLGVAFLVVAIILPIYNLASQF